LPASAQCPVQLNKRQELVKLGLDKRVLGGEELLLFLQNFKVAGAPRDVAVSRDLDSNLVSLNGAGLLNEGLGIFLAGDQGVGNFLERVQNSAFVAQRGFIADRFCLAILAEEPATLENWTREVCSDIPGIRAASGERGKFGADLAQKRSETELRKEIGDSNTNLGAGGAQVLFCLANVGPALEQGRRKAERNFGGRLLKETVFTRHGAGISAEQNVDAILGDDDLAFKVGDGCGGGGEGGFGGGSFELGNNAALEALAEDAQAFAKGIGGAFCDFESAVKREQFEIGGSDFAHNGNHEVAAGFLAGEELGAGGFVQAANAAPEIDFPGGVAREKKSVRGPAGESGRAIGGVLAAADGALVIELRKKGGAIFHQDGAGLFDASDGDTKVVVVGEGSADEVVEGLVFESFPPGEIGEGVGRDGE